jgi:N-acyl-D-aspartate/D-glutamate deacylase
MASCDLLIRNATIVDGTGADPFEGSIAVKDGRIVALDAASGQGSEEIDAKGAIVTPGFVDIHTHFDGQATWSNRLNPSTNHGVTTVVAGNCGVGFAPCRPEDQNRLVRLMEGVEDIPEVVLSEGLPWAWESFPDYLNYLASRRYDADIAAYLPHAPLRVYAMGQRGADREPATALDVAVMARIAKEAISAGAIGFSTSRTLHHRSSDRHLMPNATSAESELSGIAMALREIGRGVLQLICDFEDPVSDFGLLRRLVERSGRPLSLSLQQLPSSPGTWRTILDMISEANAAGLPIRAQVIGRPVGLLMGLALSRNPFTLCPSYQSIAGLALEERHAALSDPEVRARILAEYPDAVKGANPIIYPDMSGYYVMADPPSYEPKPEDSVDAQARARDLVPLEYAYDLMMAEGGKTIFYNPCLNFIGNSLAAPEAMLGHPDTLMGLGDGGAHVGAICDASSTTFLLTHWFKQSRSFSLPQVVKMLTANNAQAMGMLDRGVIAPGYRADFNVIDLDRLQLRRPHVVHDLPCGRGRLDQRAEGYVATICAGEVTYRDGVSAGNLPGRLVRGAQPTPLTCEAA